jgi:hypothetical protein
MPRTAIPILFVVILFVLSGCNALDFSTQNDQVSVTPAPVPTDEPASRQPPRRISCLPDSPIENISEFVSNSTVPDWDNTSFTVREVRTAIYQNGSLRSHASFTGRIAENLSRIHFTSTEIGSSYGNLSGVQDYLRVTTIPPRRLPARQPVHREIWTNSTQVLSRTTSGHIAHYYAGSPPYSFGHLKGAIAPVREIIGGISVIDVERTCIADRFTRNGTTLYRIKFSTPTPGVPENVTVRGNATGSALIDSRGIIHELRYDYTIRTADGTVFTVTESIYVTNIGSTAVNRPMWYGMAMNQTQSQNQTQIGRFEWLGKSNRMGERSDAFDFYFDFIAIV